MQTKVIIRYHYIPIRMAKIRLTIPSVRKIAEELELSYSVAGMQNDTNALKKYLTIL